MPQFTLLPATIITASGSNTVYGPTVMNLDQARGVILQGDFVYGSGGTTLKAWVQSTVDGTNWHDVACFAFTTATKRRLYNLSARTAVITIYTPVDAALADDTAVDGWLGAQLRVKYTSTGTYGGSSTITITAVTR